MIEETPIAPEVARYERGVVYALVSKADPSVQYIGSTVIPLHLRLSVHLSAHKAKVSTGTGSNVTSFQVFNLGDYDIKELEECLNCTRYELKVRERYHIENNRCVNARVPTRTLAEYRASEQFQATQKKWQDAHPTCGFDWRAAHPGYMSVKCRAWRDLHDKEITCECGKTIRLMSKYNHVKTKYHREHYPAV